MIYEWLLSALSMIGFSAVGHLYTQQHSSSKKISAHDVLFAEVTTSLGNISKNLDGHMERESESLGQLHVTVTAVQTAVARIEGRLGNG